MRHTVIRGRNGAVPLFALALCANIAVAQGNRGTPPAAPGASTAVPGATPRVRSGLLVRPDTVMVGDPFTLVVTVLVPASARIEWPAIEDTAAVVGMRAPVSVASASDGPMRRETATYSLAAWDVGSLALGVPNPTVRYGVTTMRVPIDSARVYVRSVLPGDSSLHVPKPGKGMFPREIPWWERWWPVAAVLAGLLLLWWLFRRRKRTPARRAAPPPLDVYARAIHDFERLDRLSLTDAGERGRAVALAVEILRSYLVARVPDAALSLTSPELLDVTNLDERVPHERLFYLLDDADAIKFARRVVNGARAKELTTEARAIVDSVEAAEQVRRKAEAERRAREAKANDDARQRDEDDARRKSRRKAGAA